MTKEYQIYESIAHTVKIWEPKGYSYISNGRIFKPVSGYNTLELAEEALSKMPDTVHKTFVILPTYHM